MNLIVGILIPLLPLIAAALCLVCCWKHAWSKASWVVAMGGVVLSFVVSMLMLFGGAAGSLSVYEWMAVGDFSVGVRYFFDPLTLLMLFVVTGVGSLIVVYAGGYMKGDPGYPRFFAAVALFIFAMTTLVMADSLVLLFLGWEGVGLCSYLLIGHYFQKDFAVQAAKKAFIVNRVGDFCLLIGLFLLFQEYGTLSLHGYTAEGGAVVTGILEQATLALKGTNGEGSSAAIDTWIPMLLMMGAFGKSAQFPLFVWLPDAMAGPTPVSALVHAATMVTSGVYLIVRMLPVFQLSPCALVTVACVGGFTALFAATIALCSNDLKGVFAYSTVSQLGYMFMGIGAVSAGGAIMHLYTHAFFKALLFLTAGSVMHALAGQLDIRTMSGLRHRMPVTAALMFVGCLALAGLPVLSAGFWSKDMILADTMAVGLYDWRGYGVLYQVIAWVGIVTALLTAFYTFRLWFTVFMGEERFVMGDEHHDEESHDTHSAGEVEAEAHNSEQREVPAHHDHMHDAPHEMPWWPMNAPLVLLAIGSTVVGVWLFGLLGGNEKAGFEKMTLDAVALVEHHGDTGHGDEHAPLPSFREGPGEGAPVASDSHVAAPHAENEHPPLTPPEGRGIQTDPHAAADAHAGHHGLHHATFLGGDVHVVMMWMSGLIALAGIAAAAYFHWVHRPARDAVAKAFAPVVTLLRNKWYVDEIYDAIIVQPLKLFGQVFYIFDALLIDGLVKLTGSMPRILGTGVKPAQSGKMQGYGLGMALGVALLALIVLVAFVKGTG